MDQVVPSQDLRTLLSAFRAHGGFIATGSLVWTSGNRTGGLDAKGSPNGTATTLLQVAIVATKKAAGLPPFLPAAALALFAVWASLRRRG